MSDTEVNVKFTAQVQSLLDGMRHSQEAVEAATGGIGGNLGTLSKSFASLGTMAIAAAGVGLAIEGIRKSVEIVTESVKKTMELAESYEKLQYQTGESTAQLSVYDLALKLSGGTMEQLSGWVGAATKAIQANSAALVTAGVATSEAKLKGMSYGEYLVAVSAKAETYSNAQQKMAFWQLAMGKAGVQSAKDISEFAQRLPEAEEFVKSMGASMTGDLIETCQQVGIETAKMQYTWQLFQVAIGSRLIPIILDLAKALGPILGGALDVAIDGANGAALIFEELDYKLAQLQLSVVSTVLIMKASFSGLTTFLKALAMGEGIEGAYKAAEGSVKQVQAVLSAANVQAAGLLAVHEKIQRMLLSPKEEAAPKKKDDTVTTPGTTSDITAAWELRKAKLIAQGAEEAAYGAEAERNYWQSRVTSLGIGTAEWAKGILKIKDLQGKVDDEYIASAKNFEDETLQILKNNNAERVAAATNYYNVMLAKFGPYHKAVIDAHKKMVAEQQSASESEHRILVANDALKATLALAALDREQELVARGAQAGELSAEQELARLIEIGQRKLAVKIEQYRAEQGLADLSEEKRAEIDNKLAMAKEEANAKEIANKQQTQDKLNAITTSAWAPLRTAMETNIAGVLNGQQSLVSGMRGIWQGYWTTMGQQLSKYLTAWLTNDKVMLASSEMKSIKLVAQEVWASTKKIATWVWEGLKFIGIQAWQAAASVYKSIAAIPFVGPFLAPVMAAAALAAVIGMGSKLMSAEHGFDIPAGLNPIVQAHEEEMILPREHADTIRGLKDGGKGDTFVVQALDSQSFLTALGNNQGPLHSVLSGMARNYRV